MDNDDEESIISEESLNHNDADSFVSDTSARCNAGENGITQFVSDVLSPMNCMSDYTYCQLKCNFPNIVEEVNDILSSNLHHLVFDEEEEEGGEEVLEKQSKAKEEVEVTVPNNNENGEGVGGGGGEVNQGEESDDGNVVEEGPTETNEASDEQQVVEKEGQDEEEADDEEDEEEEEEEEEQNGEEIVVEVDGEKNSEEAQVEVVKGRWLNKHTEFENASYSPSKGFVLKTDGKLPQLAKDQVMIRVDATTIAARDCFERHRRDKNEDLKEDVFVPGHEIIGHVVRAGEDVEAESLLDKRVAAILPNGGGCSQYVCINARDAIAVPQEADDEDVVTLLSTYMTAYQCLQSVVDADDDDANKAKEEEDAESVVVAKAKGDDETQSVSTTATDIESVSTKATTDVESKSESKTGVEKAEPKDGSTTPGDTVEEKEKEEKEEEEKKSPLFGKNVLIIDCGSPVGKALIELAQNAGATVQTTTQSISTFFVMRWRGEMDLVVDTVGDVDNNPALYRIMKTRGKLVRVNITSCGEKYIRQFLVDKTPAEKDVSYYGRVVKDKAIEYDVFQSFDDDREEFAEDLAYLHHLLKSGKIKPKVSPQVGFGELNEEWDNLMAVRNDFAVVCPWKLGFTTMNG